MVGSKKVFLLLLLIGYTQCHGQEQDCEGDSQCVSREGFDRLEAQLVGIKDELQDDVQEINDKITALGLSHARQLQQLLGNISQELARSIRQLRDEVQARIRHESNTISNNCLSHAQQQQELLDKVQEINTNSLSQQILLQQQELAGSLSQLQDEVQGIRQEIITISNNCVSQQTHLQQQQQTLEEIAQELTEVRANNLTGSFHHPATSCHYTNLPPGSQSGHYWIQSGSTVHGTTREYCDITRRCCGSTEGWMRVAHLDMTDPTQYCPPGFRLVTSPKRSCGRPGPVGCVSTTFPVHGVQYSRVCGRIKAYQYATPGAFFPYYGNCQRTIDGLYVEGVSLTHGQSPRKHIWTFATALDETRSDHYVCPCTKTGSAYTGVVPAFIGQDYFCDTGSRGRYQYIFYPGDPLWDGAGCGPTSTCCSFNNPPWFCKQLPQPTTDDIELRLCADSATHNEDIPLEIVEIYVK